MHQIFEDRLSYSSSKIKRYNKPIQTIVEKCQFFNQNKQWINNIIYHYISLCTIYHHIALYMINHIYHSHFIVVLDGIICFSVCVCDNSLLVLRTRFQVFSFATKKVLQGFSSDKKILMLLLPVLFHQQNHVSVFQFLILAKLFEETFIMSLKSTSFPKELW